MEKDKSKTRSKDTGLDGVVARTTLEHVVPKPEPHLASVRILGWEGQEWRLESLRGGLSWLFCSHSPSPHVWCLQCPTAP